MLCIRSRLVGEGLPSQVQHNDVEPSARPCQYCNMYAIAMLLLGASLEFSVHLGACSGGQYWHRSCNGPTPNKVHYHILSRLHSSIVKLVIHAL